MLIEMITNLGNQSPSLFVDVQLSFDAFELFLHGDTINCSHDLLIAVQTKQKILMCEHL